MLDSTVIMIEHDKTLLMKPSEYFSFDSVLQKTFVKVFNKHQGFIIVHGMDI